MSEVRDRRIPLPCGVQEAESQWYMSDDIDRKSERIEIIYCAVNSYRDSCLECYRICFQLYNELPLYGRISLVHNKPFDLSLCFKKR